MSQGLCYRKNLRSQANSQRSETNDKKNFQALCHEYERLTRTGILLLAGEQTVEAWAYQWFETYKKPYIGHSQSCNYDAIIRLYIVPEIGYLRLKDVRRTHLQEFLNGLSCSKSQMTKIKGTINQMFSCAEEDRLIEYSPAVHLRMPEGTEKKRRDLTEVERTALLKALEHHRARLWVLLMLECGLRRGETIPLTWSDIDFTNKLLTVNKAVEFISNQPKKKNTKTENGNRYIPIPPDLITLLKEKKKLFKPNSQDLLFSNADGGMMTEVKIRRMWKSVQRAWDIALGAKLYRNQIIESKLDYNITPHYLRHTYASELRRKELDLQEIKSLMGHADVRTSINVYTHFTKEDAIKAGQKLF